MMFLRGAVAGGGLRDRTGRTQWPIHDTAAASVLQRSVQHLAIGATGWNHEAVTIIPSASRVDAREPSGSTAGRLRKLVFGISPEEARFERRGFPPCEPAARARLETIGRTFIRGYRAALADTRPEPLGAELDRLEPELRGFAYEGAAMGLELLDRLTPWTRTRLESFLAGPGGRHAYMVHVGAGWALARLRRTIDGPRSLAGMDPLLRWLAVDGYGFHEGYFDWPRSIGEQRTPERISGYARRVFDQGLGRSLWFVEGASVERIVTAVGRFPSHRRGDLWSGLGLAAAYAGGAERAGLETLRQASGDDYPRVAQGAAFATKARARAENPAPHTELACAVLCGMSVEAAAALTDQALEDLPPDGAEPAYEVWRQRVQRRFGPAANAR